MGAAARMHRRRGQHGAHPLSANTRRRLLSDLLARAESGDIQASAALVLLSLRAEAVPAVTGRRLAAVQAGA